MILSLLDKNPYELYKGKKSNMIYLMPFGCKCFIHNNGKYTMGKFDVKSDEGIFLGYFSLSRAYKIFNKRLIV